MHDIGDAWSHRVYRTCIDLTCIRDILCICILGQLRYQASSSDNSRAPASSSARSLRRAMTLRALKRQARSRTRLSDSACRILMQFLVYIWLSLISRARVTFQAQLRRKARSMRIRSQKKRTPRSSLVPFSDYKSRHVQRERRDA